MQEVCEGKEFSFPSEEEKILRFWRETDAFHTQLARTKCCPEFVFYDGPPFATGLPHYGHILAGTIKDIVTRYKSMTGHHVTRRFGWDCHGVPVETEINNKLGVLRREDVFRMGIDKYNEACRQIVTRYVEEWEKLVGRSGRWIDFKDDYKTMDLNYMETVWWVFGQLYAKGLVYRAFKVMPCTTALQTPLSNFEADSNKKTVTDPPIMVSFPIVNDPLNAAFVAWTTTPWSLPSNLVLCVNPNLEYAKVRNKYSGSIYVVAHCRLWELPCEKPKSKENPSDDFTDSYEVLDRFPGASLVNLK